MNLDRGGTDRVSPEPRNDPVSFVEGYGSEQEEQEQEQEGPRRSNHVKQPSSYVRRVLAGETANKLPPGMHQHYHPYRRGTGSAAVMGFAKAARITGAIPRSLKEAKDSDD